MDLNDLGWNPWFEQQADGRPGRTVARVAAVDRELLLLLDPDGPFRGKPAGRFLHDNPQADRYPCVGDWVTVEKQPGGGTGLVHAVLNRTTELRRKVAGDTVEYQMIAANLDCVIVVQSCHYDFNLKRLERYLVMVRDGGAEPVILLTKTDLVEPAVLESQVQEIRSAGITDPVMTLSNVTREGVDDLEKKLKAGLTYCFVGSSGVGKSTLINHLTGRELQVTKTVSGTGEGRHTTVRRELIVLDSGALVIDNPGMREFGILGAEGGIEGSFADITGLADGCRFNDCTHISEPGCAVRAAVESGDITRSHFDNYLKLRSESEFYRMSYAEKRRKDRDFGKFIKTAKKDMESK